ncbi:MAG: choice-of-anchor Q domain-containing protein, partial [Acidobacteriota bacterium]
ACSFTNNTSAGSGGAFYIANGAAATIETSAFAQNTSFGGCCGGWGGVIDGEGAGTTITVRACTATGNSAAWGSFSHITTGTTLELVNSTLAGNTATTAGTLATPGGVYTLVNDTIVSNTNTTTDSAGLYEYSAPCHYTVSNTLVAFNTDSSGSQNNCNRRDLTTTITSLGGNLLGDTGGNCAAYFTGPGDRVNTDPLLDPAGLADNGGLDTTIALRLGSPAIGAGVAAQCPSTDERGYPRPAPSKPPTEACDSGAFEMQ